MKIPDTVLSKSQVQAMVTKSATTLQARSGGIRVWLIYQQVDRFLSLEFRHDQWFGGQTCQLRNLHLGCDFGKLRM